LFVFCVVENHLDSVADVNASAGTQPSSMSLPVPNRSPSPEFDFDQVPDVNRTEAASPILAFDPPLKTDLRDRQPAANSPVFEFDPVPPLKFHSSSSSHQPLPPAMAVPRPRQKRQLLASGMKVFEVTEAKDDSEVTFKPLVNSRSIV
jgi:hypothetical protein